MNAPKRAFKAPYCWMSQRSNGTWPTASTASAKSRPSLGDTWLLYTIDTCSSDVLAMMPGTIVIRSAASSAGPNRDSTNAAIVEMVG